MKNKWTKSLLAAAVATLFAGAAQASDIVTINPDAGGVDPTVAVASLDWAPGNALVTPVTGTVNSPAIGNVFQTYAHARLNAFQDAGGTGIGGLNLNGGVAATNYEWTYVAAFQENVSGLTGTPPTANATFDVQGGGTNFFQIWYDPTPDANNLAGTGFQGGDGTLILSGTVLPFDNATGLGRTAFADNIGPGGGPVIGNLDTFGANNYPTVQTITGQGGGRLAIQVNSFDSSYFQAGLPAIIELIFDTQLNLPFTQTDPSSCFWNGAATINGVGPNTAGGPCLVNTVGAINGNPGSGPNQVLMTDSSNNFTVAVPEPGSLALLGAALFGVGFSLRRRKL